MALSNNEKKQAQRQREKSLGVVNINVKLSAKENEQIQRACKIRGGVRGPYDKDEYIAKLIRNDVTMLESQLLMIGTCKGCNIDLPEGCNGVCKGQTDCFHHLEHRDLML